MKLQKKKVEVPSLVCMCISVPTFLKKQYLPLNYSKILQPPKISYEENDTYNLTATQKYHVKGYPIFHRTKCEFPAYTMIEID